MELGPHRVDVGGRPLLVAVVGVGATRAITTVADLVAAAVAGQGQGAGAIQLSRTSSEGADAVEAVGALASAVDVPVGVACFDGVAAAAAVDAGASFVEVVVGGGDVGSVLEVAAGAGAGVVVTADGLGAPSRAGHGPDSWAVAVADVARELGLPMARLILNAPLVVGLAAGEAPAGRSGSRSSSGSGSGPTQADVGQAGPSGAWPSDVAAGFALPLDVDLGELCGAAARAAIAGRVVLTTDRPLPVRRVADTVAVLRRVEAGGKP